MKVVTLSSSVQRHTKFHTDHNYYYLKIKQLYKDGEVMEND